MPKDQEDHLTPFLHARKSRLTIALMLMFGFSNKYIRQETHTNNNYIAYVARRLKIFRRDYRDGQSATSQYVVKAAKDYAQKELEDNIQKLLHR